MDINFHAYFIGVLNVNILKKKFYLFLTTMNFFYILFQNYFIRDNQISQSEINTCNMYILAGIAANYHC